jgi:hypothetical protein
MRYNTIFCVVVGKLVVRQGICESRFFLKPGAWLVRIKLVPPGCLKPLGRDAVWLGQRSTPGVSEDKGSKTAANGRAATAPL